MTEESDIEIVEARATTMAEVVEAFARLSPQLSPETPALTPDELTDLLSSSPSTVLLARDLQNGRIIGMLTLVIFRIPTGVRARIEDVVVDHQARGKGVGELLSREAIRRAGERGVRTIDLTSSPQREAANRLYVRLGFERRTTNVYRYTSKDGGDAP